MALTLATKAVQTGPKNEMDALVEKLRASVPNITFVVAQKAHSTQYEAVAIYPGTVNAADLEAMDKVLAAG